MNNTIERLSESTSHFLPHVHQPFDVIGRFIPVYDGREWSYQEMLCNENRQKTYQDDRIAPRDYIERKDRAMFLAVCDDLCVGSIRIGTSWSGEGYIEDLAVDVQYRHFGIGRKLMEHAVDWCREQHYGRITLETQDNNLQACRFYIKYGFILCGINTKQYASLPKYKDETALFFCLDI